MKYRVRSRKAILKVQINILCESTVKDPATELGWNFHKEKVDYIPISIPKENENKRARGVRTRHPGKTTKCKSRVAKRPSLWVYWRSLSHGIRLKLSHSKDQVIMLKHWNGEWEKNVRAGFETENFEEYPKATKGAWKTCWRNGLSFFARLLTKIQPRKEAEKKQCREQVPIF